MPAWSNRPARRWRHSSAAEAGNFWGWALVALGGLYLAWLMILPVSLGRFPPWEVEAPPPAVPEPSTGPGDVRIAQFYTTSVRISRGDSALICYSVRHARAVRLDPPGTPLPPSGKTCIQFRPPASAQYTLTATSAEGLTAQEKFNVKVQ